MQVGITNFESKCCYLWGDQIFMLKFVGKKFGFFTSATGVRLKIIPLIHVDRMANDL